MRDVEAANDVEEGRLAGAIGADDAEDLPLRQFEADLRHGDKTAKAHGQPFALEDGRGHLQPSYRRRRLGKIPCGRIRRKPMTVTPKKKIR